MLIPYAAQDRLMGGEQMENIAYGAARCVVAGEQELLDLTDCKCLEGLIYSLEISRFGDQARGVGIRPSGELSTNGQGSGKDATSPTDSTCFQIQATVFDF